jgi:hypothetical protein
VRTTEREIFVYDPENRTDGILEKAVTTSKIYFNHSMVNKENIESLNGKCQGKEKDQVPVG